MKQVLKVVFCLFNIIAALVCHKAGMYLLCAYFSFLAGALFAFIIVHDDTIY